MSLGRNTREWPSAFCGTALRTCRHGTARPWCRFTGLRGRDRLSPEAVRTLDFMTTFDEMLAEWPLAQRSVQIGVGGAARCFVGVPSDVGQGRVPLTAMPAAPTGMCFLAGGEQSELVAAFVSSPYASTVELLRIGTSSYGRGRGGLDYRACVHALTGAHLPSLRRLDLGIWDLFSNSHASYGTVGDVTRLLQGLPHLHALGLFGLFTLSQPLVLPQLRELSLNIDDPVTGHDLGPPAAETVALLLSADMPQVREIDILMEWPPPQGTTPWRLPRAFLQGASVPRLEHLTLPAQMLADGEAEVLLSSPLAGRVRIDVE